MVFPLSNRADTLNTDFHYLQRRIGQYLGIGRSPADFDDEQITEIQDIIDEGIRQYAYPPPIAPQYGVGMDQTHEWQFLRPFYEFQTADGQRRYLLPETFEDVIGNVSYDADDTNYTGYLQRYPANRLQILENRETGNAPPEFFAIEPRSSDGTSPQRYQIVLHSTPDDVYTLHFQYQSQLLQVTENNPYLPGGQSHGSGFYHSCMAVAEMRKIGQQGPWWQKFMQILSANIMRDRRRVPDVLGYNDNNMRGALYGRGSLRRRGGIYYDTLLINGSEFTD